MLQSNFTGPPPEDALLVFGLSSIEIPELVARLEEQFHRRVVWTIDVFEAPIINLALRLPIDLPSASSDLARITCESWRNEYRQTMNASVLWVMEGSLPNYVVVVPEGRLGYALGFALLPDPLQFIKVIQAEFRSKRLRCAVVATPDAGETVSACRERWLREMKRACFEVGIVPQRIRMTVVVLDHHEFLPWAVVPAMFLLHVARATGDPFVLR